MTDATRATVRLDLRACHDTPPRHVVGYASAIPILSHQSHAGRFAFPSRSGLFSHRGDTGQKAFLRPAWAQEFEGWPNSFNGCPNKGWAHERPKLRRTSLKGVSIHDQISTGLPWTNPREQDTRVPFKRSSCQNTKFHSHTHEGSELPPGQFYLNHPGARGLHPLGALAHTLW